MQQLSKSAQIVQDFLERKGHGFTVVELAASTRTAEEAAAAIGCTVAQIVKSLVFKTKKTEQPILILVSGTNRVNEKIISQVLGEKIERADADFVREVTGFAIGGIPPVAHKTEIQTLIDKDLIAFDRVWAAAGTPHAVFEIDAKALSKLSGGQVIAVQ